MTENWILVRARVTLRVSLSTLNMDPLGEPDPCENRMNILSPTRKQQTPAHFVR